MSAITDKARELRATIESLAQENLSDTDALDNAELFPNWDGNGKHYDVGERVRYEGVLYKVIQAHDSQETWTPDWAAALFAKVLIPEPAVIPEWEQPNSTNPYMKGDVVAHNEKIWVSMVDNNVWEPGTAGTESLWTEVTE